MAKGETDNYVSCQVHNGTHTHTRLSMKIWIPLGITKSLLCVCGCHRYCSVCNDNQRQSKQWDVLIAHVWWPEKLKQRHSSMGIQFIMLISYYYEYWCREGAAKKGPAAHKRNSFFSFILIIHYMLERRMICQVILGPLLSPHSFVCSISTRCVHATVIEYVMMNNDRGDRPP